MTRIRILLLTLILLLCLAAGALVVYAQRAMSEPTYTVAQVRALLAHQRRLWAGRIVRVRGTVTTTQETFPCARPSCALVGIAASIDDAPANMLWLGQGADDPFWATIRRLPFGARLAPATQQPRVAQPATYRIRLLLRPDCSGMRCYDAVLLDAQPPAMPGGPAPAADRSSRAN
jgi:hypothetical protein